MTGFSEKSALEDYLVQKLQEKGWRFVPAKELEREGLEEPLLSSLSAILKKINGSEAVGEEEIRQAVNELFLVPSGVEGCNLILRYMREGIAVKSEKEKIPVKIKLFDNVHVENNDFIVSRQVYYRGKSSGEPIIADIVLYVNAIPIVIIECKSPVSPFVSWADAVSRINVRYAKEVPELFKYLQVGIAAGSVARYFPIMPGSEEDVEISEWKVKKESDSVDNVLEMLKPDDLLNIIQNFLFIKTVEGKTKKILPRYMQYRAANLVVRRVLSNLSGEESKNRGLVWHWQGSGKTFTMFSSALKLFNAPQMKAPSIFIVVDRKDLQQQHEEEFASFGQMKLETISSIDELKKNIMHDEYRGKKGVFLTLVHKFGDEEFRNLAMDLKTMPSAIETIRNRKNVVIFVDEGHRTQYGVMAGTMRAIFQSAFFFGFTGTPIALDARNTFDKFSNLPDEEYIDRYFIEESIDDGFTVEIAYQPRLEKEVHLDKDDLELFLKSDLDELPDELKEKVEERVRRRFNAIKIFLENETRIEKICGDLCGHFKENVDDRFKAMVVAGSRKACVIYKRELDKLLPKECSEVVMTFNKDDEKAIRAYHDELSGRFRGLEDDEIRRNIVDSFKLTPLPKILIVTDMLLTGFDAPVLQTMYLDKPLKGHRLLQAVARTNRPYRNLKQAGMIIDYVGILNELDRAFRMYKRGMFKNTILDLGKLREEFVNYLHECMKFFEGIPRDKYDRDTLLKAFEAITINEGATGHFLFLVRKLQRLFELLGPDIVKVEFLQEYKWITAVYTYYLAVTQGSDEVDACVDKYFRKTLKHVHQSMEITELRKDLPVISFGPEYIKNIEKKLKNPREKAANIVFVLNRLMLVERGSNLVYETVADKVERILKLWQQKNKDYELICREGTAVLNEVDELKKRREKLGLLESEYALFLPLEQELQTRGIKVSPDDAKDLYNVLSSRMFTGWSAQKSVVKDVQRDIRGFLRKRYIKAFKDVDEMDVLAAKLEENLKKYGRNENAG